MRLVMVGATLCSACHRLPSRHGENAIYSMTGAAVCLPCVRSWGIEARRQLDRMWRLEVSAGIPIWGEW